MRTFYVMEDQHKPLGHLLLWDVADKFTVAMIRSNKKSFVKEIARRSLVLKKSDNFVIIVIAGDLALRTFFEAVVNVDIRKLPRLSLSPTETIMETEIITTLIVDQWPLCGLLRERDEPSLYPLIVQIISDNHKYFVELKEASESAVDHRLLS